MPLTDAQVKALEKGRSQYGCGLDTCKRCYPIQYRCAFCNEDFTQPLANGEHYECEACGFDSKETY